MTDRHGISEGALLAIARAGYTTTVIWRTNPTRRVWQVLSVSGVAVGYLDGGVFEPALLYIPDDDDKELAETLLEFEIETVEPTND